MMSITTGANGNATPAKTAAANTAPGAQQQQDRFLNLLVAQMKNQDPLNPTDNSQITTQLAQISTVNGIDKLNESMLAFTNNFSAFQTLQAASLVGKNVLVPGSSIELTDNGGVAAYELSQAVDNLQITIKDAAGAVVYQGDLGPQSPGQGSYVWDGKDSPGNTVGNGNYTMSWSASQGGRSVPANSLSYGRVLGVNQTPDGITLSVSGQNKSLMISQVKQIL